MKDEIKFEPDLLPYKIDGKLVRRGGYVIKGAEVATFKPLNHHFSVDAKHVFADTESIRGVGPDSFQVLNELYARSGNKIYYSYGTVPAADCETFEVLDAGHWSSDYGVIFEGYAKDRNGIWFYAKSFGKPRVLTKADPGSLAVLPYGYAKDAVRVFFEGLLIAKAKPESFTLITQRYARDSKRIFYGNTVLEGVDYDSFEVVDAKKNRAKDKQHLYEYHRRVDAYWDQNS
jgi:hypothetical protein